MPDLIFEALASACKWDFTRLTRTERGRLNRAAKELRELGVDPSEISARASAYCQTFPSCVLTPQALVGNWSLLEQEIARRSNLDRLTGLIGGVKRIPK